MSPLINAAAAVVYAIVGTYLLADGSWLGWVWYVCSALLLACVYISTQTEKTRSRIETLRKFR